MTEHSAKFDDVKKYCDLRIWKKSTVKLAVKKKWITAAEYEEIVGEAYSG